MDKHQGYDPAGTAAFVGLCIAAVISLVFLPFAIGIWLIVLAICGLGSFVMWGLGSTAYVRRSHRRR